MNFHKDCITRGPTRNERWVTFRKRSGINSQDIWKHKNADVLIDGKIICSYQIQWFSGRWSGIYYPGKNDVVNHKKNEDVWNNESFKAGRRQWTMFSDHTHRACYCRK